LFKPKSTCNNERFAALLRSSQTTNREGFNEQNATSATKLVNVIYMRTTAKALWDALAQPEFTRPYYTGIEIKTDLKPGGRFDYNHRFDTTNDMAPAWKASCLRSSRRKNWFTRFIRNLSLPDRRA
jgi:hypothetical protein